MKLKMPSSNNAITAIALLSWVSVDPAIAEDSMAATQQPAQIALFYSDGAKPDYGVDAVNQRLQNIGVQVSRVAIPEGAKPILRTSAHRALSGEESEQLIQHFQLGRRELLDAIRSAGRKPEMHRGGYLQTSERGVPAYPKVYDMQALDHETTMFLQHKFGRLHVNSSDAGVGIDEVMTIVAGGPYTWFFVLDDNVVGRLHLGKVHENGQAWRISYPGLVPHGGYFDADHGLVVAYAHGPRQFVMRYDDASVEGHELLGENPWIDFSGKAPRLLGHASKDAIASSSR